MNTANTDTLNYGDHTIAMGSLPAVSLHRLASYGLSHLLGNQAASKVVAWASKDENKAATDDQKATKKAEFQALMLTALADGTIGQHASRGPATDPTEAEAERLAKAEVIATLKSNNIKVPKKDEVVEFANGNKFNMEQLVERRMEAHGERLMTEAKASLTAKAKAKAKADAAMAAKIKDQPLDL